jgi:hypothetical protein
LKYESRSRFEVSLRFSYAGTMKKKGAGAIK